METNEILASARTARHGDSAACFTFTFDTPQDAFVLGGAFDDRDQITYLAEDGEVVGETFSPHPFAVDFMRDFVQMVKCEVPDEPIKDVTPPEQTTTVVEETPPITIVIEEETPPTVVEIPEGSTEESVPVKEFLPSTGSETTPAMLIGASALVSGALMLVAARRGGQRVARRFFKAA